VSPLVDEKGFSAAIGDFLAVCQSLGTLSFDSSDTTLVGEQKRIGEDLLALQKRYPGVTRPPYTVIGGMNAWEVLYLYPQGKTPVTIYPLIFPGAAAGILSLEPQLDRHFSMEVESQGEPMVFRGETGIDGVVAAPEGAKLERTGSGHLVLNWKLHGIP